MTLDKKRDWLQEAGISYVLHRRVIRLTPLFALHLLRRTTTLEWMDPFVVLKYARAIRAGTFSQATMILHDDGSLYDGHHRVCAVLLSGLAIPVELCWRKAVRQ